MEVAANVITETVATVQTTEIPMQKNHQNETNSTHPLSDTTTSIVLSQSTEQTIDTQTVPAMEQLSLDTTNDLSAANSQERVNTNEILLPQQQQQQQQESEMTGSCTYNN